LQTLAGFKATAPQLAQMTAGVSGGSFTGQFFFSDIGSSPFFIIFFPA
jgi:hypothetical protein